MSGYNYIIEDRDLKKKRYWRQVQAMRDRYEGRMVMYFRSVLNKQFRKLADSIDSTNYSSDTILETITKEPIEKAFKYLYLTVGVDFARSAFNGLKSSAKGYLIKENEEDMIDEWYEYLLQFVSTRATKKIISVTSSSREIAKAIIRATLEQTLDEGLGADATARAIRKNLVKQGIEMNQWRALRIARTEVMSASNIGTHAAAQATNLPMDKYWIATYDNRTRDTHRVMEEQNPRPMEEPFLVGGVWPAETPHDPDLPPEEVINCRCTIAYSVKDI